MRGDAAGKRRGEFDHIVAREKQIDGGITREMAAFQQHRHTISFGQDFSGFMHGRKITDRLADQPAGLTEVWRQQGSEREQFPFVDLNRVVLEQSVAAGRDHYWIDHERDWSVRPKRPRDFRDDSAGEKQPGLDRRHRETAEQHFDLITD